MGFNLCGAGLLFPAFEQREVLQELLAVLVGGEVIARVLVELVDVLDAEVDHLLHGALLGEVAVFVAVCAVLAAEASVGFGATVGIAGQRHAAALAEMLIFGKGIIHCFYLSSLADKRLF